MSSTKKVLFLTHEEYGQAGVHITVSTTLAERYGDDVEVHLGSFGKLASRCPAGVTFHTITGEGQMALSNRQYAERYPNTRPATGVSISHRPSFWGGMRMTTQIDSILFPWAPAEYLRITQEVAHLLEDIKPDLVLIDPLFGFGVDACRAKGIRAVTLSPLSWDVNARGSVDNENKENAFKWPCVGTGYPFPLPCYLVPLNAIRFIWSVLWLLVLSPHVRRLSRARVAAGHRRTLPLFDGPRTILCPGTRALDLPGNDIARIIPFGPLILDYPPVADIDPDLARWLARGGKGKTILTVLGSHFRFDEREVRQMMEALEVVLETRKDLQVLWKLVPDVAHDGAKADLAAMAKRLDGRMRVTEWLKVDPPALLQSGYVGVSVHHGGANSYFEALGSGVPQIVIAGWSDCYDYAQRATELGIGLWANKEDAISTKHVQSALLRVLGSTPTDAVAATFATKAAQAALTSRRADAMPHVPGSQEELDIVTFARKGKGDGGEVYVEGRDVAAEWVYKVVTTGAPLPDQ